MADQIRNDQNAENARNASGKTGSKADGAAGGMGDGQDRKPTKDRKQNSPAEHDDVAEDRNLSGASTWLTLPDQPKDDDSRDLDDTSDRQSNR